MISTDSASKNKGSMDLVHYRGSMDPAHILMDLVHGPGPWSGSMDRGSMFCTFPNQRSVRSKHRTGVSIEE